MQHHLLTMFFLSPSHELSHREIADALWPKKPDASETLYTLIRRLKVVLSQHSSLTIIVDRGRSYSLTPALSEEPTPDPFGEGRGGAPLIVRQLSDTFFARKQVKAVPLPHETFFILSAPR